MSETPRLFGDLLREFRARAGLSQSDLAEKANISEDAVGALERGVRKAPYRSTVALLAKALDLTAKESGALEIARIAARSKPSGAGFSHNLEAARTSLVGREADVEHVLKLLRRSRLVSVTGSGGVGKTRAALEAARRLLGNLFNEIWFVDLAPLSDGDFIPARIASTIQPSLANYADTIPTLATALAKRRMLLILDNCEHLIVQAAQVADAILEHCPQVNVLATSRERLNVAGEFVYRLPSLALEPCIDLFVERAEAVGPQIAFDAKTLPSVEEVARRLDGIPLAVELTAAQVPVLGLETLRKRLHENLRLPSGRRDLPARQQTVLATIEWSYDLLTTHERALLCDVSVFAGGFTLAAAEAVCGRDVFDRRLVLPLLSSLANKSLLNVENVGDGLRYSLLESVRGFGLERLRETDTCDSVARRHAQWLARIGDEVESEAAGTDPVAELLPEFDNVRAAVAWSLNSPGQEDRALAGLIITGLFGLWDRMGRHREHRRLVETALDCIDEERYPLVVSNLLRDLMLRTQRERIALDSIDRALKLCEQSRDETALVKLLIVISQVQATHGMLSEAERSLARCYELLIRNRMEDSRQYCSNLLTRSLIRSQQGRFDEARADVVAAEAKALALGYRFAVVRIYYVRRAELEYAAGNRELALKIFESMIDSEFGSDQAVASVALWRIPVLRLLLGDVEDAVEPLRDLLHLARSGNASFTSNELEYAALGLALLGKPVLAAQLLGRVRAQEQRSPFRRSLIRQDAHDLLVSTLRKRLSEEEIAAALSSGALLTPDEAIDEALSALDLDPVAD